MTFGKYLQRVRVGSSRALRDVAATVGIEPRLLSDYEHDRATPPVDVLSRLERVYYFRDGVLVDILRRMTPPTLAAAIAATPQGEAERDGAGRACRVSQLVNADDYAAVLMGQAGHLGVCEL